MSDFPQITLNTCYNCDSLDLMQAMKEQGIKADWCIADPPYCVDIKTSIMKKGGQRHGNAATEKRNYDIKDWDNERIGNDYINLMRECSNEQIIFGGNYYTDILPPIKSWLVWYKIPEYMRNDFPDCELAWVSTGVARVLPFTYNGMLQHDMKNKHIDRFHPTEKPIGMYCKLLQLYTKEGDIILDPFAGSQSLRIACHKTQRKYIGAEIDKDYYDKGCEWYNSIARQISFFD